MEFGAVSNIYEVLYAQTVPKSCSSSAWLPFWADYRLVVASHHGHSREQQCQKREKY